MQKSFKKVIACLLAVLMVAFSMPFSALAAVGDYTPDIQLQFSSFFDAVEETDPTVKTASSADCYESSCLAAFPIQYDAENGTLKATKEDISTYNTYWEADAVDEDWELAEGDVFAVTIRLDNVDKAASGNINIRFSDNITPAGLYSYKSGKTTKYAFGTLPKDGTEVVGFNSPVAKFSAGYKDGTSLYPGMNDTLIGDLSCIQEDPHAVADDGWSDDMMTATLVCDGNYVDVSSIAASNGFFNIEDGSYDYENGYTYKGKFIVATFVFQITGEGPIQFALQDPTGEYDPQLNNACFFADKAEGQRVEDATTYATNRFVRTSTAEGYQGDETVAKWPGSAKMTFMGKNDNIVTVTFKNADGSVISSEACAKGDALVAPALPETIIGETTHTIYAWDTELPATVTGTATYQVVSTEEEHDFSIAHVTKMPTCTEKGVMTYTCSVCGATTTDEIEKSDHVKGTAVRENEVPATCIAEGSYDEVIYCTVCKNEVSREKKTIGKLPHSYAAVVTDPTCTEQGYTTYTCSECGDSYTGDYTTELGHDYVAVVTDPTCTAQGYTTHTCSRCPDSYVDTYTDALGHTKAEAVKENEVAATCTEGGSYDEVVYCSVCHEELSREAKTTDALGHTPAAAVTENKVAATYDKAGSYDEVVYCSVCKTEISRTKKTIAKLPKTSLAKATVIGVADKVYTGSAIKPAVTVKLGSTTLKNGTDYTVTYTNNKNVGKATVTITGIKKYSGTIKKTFKINPKATKLTSVAAASKGFTAKWSKVTTQTTGYEIQYSTSSKFTKSTTKTATVTKNSTASKKITKLTAKKKYYVRIRTYKTVNGVKYYSAWSASKTVTTKK